MSDLLSLPPPLLLLVPLAVAAGIDLYLTLLVAGLYLFLGDSILGPPPPLPVDPRVLLLGLAALYLLELSAELSDTSALLWHGLQLILRPLGGGLLGITLLRESPTLVLLAGATAAAAVTAFAHVLFWGEGLYLRLLPERHVSPVTFGLAADTLALGVGVVAWEEPSLGFLLTLAGLVAGLVLGGPLHSVVRFGACLIRDRIWGHLSQQGWTPASRLPSWVRRWSGDPESARGLRGQRAGARRLPGARGFREGWLVEHGDGPFFLFRSGLGRVRAVPLREMEWGEGETKTLALRIPLEAPGGARAALFLQKSRLGAESHKW